MDSGWSSASDPDGVTARDRWGACLYEVDAGHVERMKFERSAGDFGLENVREIPSSTPMYVHAYSAIYRAMEVIVRIFFTPKGRRPHVLYHTLRTALDSSRSHFTPQLFVARELEQLQYIVVERIRGTRLSDILERGTVTAARTLKIVEDLALGVARLHKDGVHYLGFDPSNVIIRHSDGHPVFVRFGVCVKTADRKKPLIVGTRSDYLAPDLSSGLVGPSESCDVYSLGMCLALMVASCAEADDCLTPFLQKRPRLPVVEELPALWGASLLANRALWTSSASRSLSVEDFCQAVAKVRAYNNSIMQEPRGLCGGTVKRLTGRIHGGAQAIPMTLLDQRLTPVRTFGGWIVRTTQWVRNVLRGGGLERAIPIVAAIAGFVWIALPGTTSQRFRAGLYFLSFALVCELVRGTSAKRHTGRWFGSVFEVPLDQHAEEKRTTERVK